MTADGQHCFCKDRSKAPCNTIELTIASEYAHVGVKKQQDVEAYIVRMV